MTRLMIQGRSRSIFLPVVAMLAMACGGGDPQLRAKYDADKARCQQIADSMYTVAKSRGGEVDKEDFEPARVSCMDYRGWRNGRFNRAALPPARER